MTERVPTTAEREPRLNQTAATAAEHAAVESHGEEKKASWTKRFIGWPLLNVITLGAFAIERGYKLITWAEGAYSKLAGGGGGGGGHAPKKAESHGGGHGGGHH